MGEVAVPHVSKRLEEAAPYDVEAHLAVCLDDAVVLIVPDEALVHLGLVLAVEPVPGPRRRGQVRLALDRGSEIEQKVLGGGEGLFPTDPIFEAIVEHADEQESPFHLLGPDIIRGTCEPATVNGCPQEEPADEQEAGISEHGSKVPIQQAWHDGEQDAAAPRALPALIEMVELVGHVRRLAAARPDGATRSLSAGAGRPTSAAPDTFCNYRGFWASQVRMVAISSSCALIIACASSRILGSLPNEATTLAMSIAP